MHDFEHYELAFTPRDIAERPTRHDPLHGNVGEVVEVNFPRDNWAADAECSREENSSVTMFPSSPQGVEKAIQICNNCIVIEDCLLDLELTLKPVSVYGIRAGMSQKDQKAHLKQLQKSQKT